jgi:hypothetical protein
MTSTQHGRRGLLTAVEDDSAGTERGDSFTA